MGKFKIWTHSRSIEEQRTSCGKLILLGRRGTSLFLWVLPSPGHFSWHSHQIENEGIKVSLARLWDSAEPTYPKRLTSHRHPDPN